MKLVRHGERGAERPGLIGSVTPEVMRQRFNEDVRAWNQE